VAVGEAFPTGPMFLLAKSSFPSLKTPTVLSQQELENPVGKAFANRVGVFANSLALLAKCMKKSLRDLSPFFVRYLGSSAENIMLYSQKREDDNDCAGN
jgi:hypothetical protein